MPASAITNLADSFVSASAVARSGRGSEFYRAVHAGRFHQLATGVYVPTALWSTLNSDERYLAVIQATHRSTSRELVFSHTSAAALWELPIVGKWPARPEVTVGSSPSGESRVGFTARKYPLPVSVDVIDGVRVTALTRTCVDIARTTPLLTSLPMIDAALAGRTRGGVTLDPGALAAEAAGVQSPRGMARCREALRLADGESGSPGESASRLGMHLLGLPVPILQQPFYDAAGLIGIVDFWWPAFNLVGEFDGLGKYLRQDLLNGQSTADAVIAEKRREDRLRATSLRVTRWGWATALSVERLGRHLRGAGLS